MIKNATYKTLYFNFALLMMIIVCSLPVRAGERLSDEIDRAMNCYVGMYFSELSSINSLQGKSRQTSLKEAESLVKQSNYTKWQKEIRYAVNFTYDEIESFTKKYNKEAADDVYDMFPVSYFVICSSRYKITEYNEQTEICFDKYSLVMGIFDYKNSGGDYASAIQKFKVPLASVYGENDYSLVSDIYRENNSTANKLTSNPEKKRRDKLFEIVDSCLKTAHKPQK